MYDVYSKNKEKWFFSGKCEIFNEVINLYISSIPFNNQIILIKIKELFKI